MASGDSLGFFHAHPDKIEGTATPERLNGQDYLAFDSGTDEDAIYIGRMPQNYDDGNITLHYIYHMASATSNNVEWEAEWELLDENDNPVDQDNFNR